MSVPDDDAPSRFRGRSVVSADDFTKRDLLYVLEAARRFDPGPEGTHHRFEPLLQGRVLGTLFFEPSTRTRLSFESAMLRLGGRVLGFADAKMSSFSKGESLADTVRVVANYCDAMVLRHPMEGAARLASEKAGVPVLNGGDGSNQHPTQTLLDLYTIRKAMDRLDGLKVGFMGDLRYGRTVHSLTNALLHWDVELSFIGPPSLQLPEDLRAGLAERGRLGPEVASLDEIESLDVLYVTRIQKERFPDPLDYERVRDAYRIDQDAVARFGSALKILHPLPRVNEVHPDLDSHPGALYFDQTLNGVTVRMALLHLILGEEGA
ncbi:MAG: aspartate carbamoyltransferase [Planctomycetota bacterium]|jgi:aspartate carbamoyltransferase catalytic subunit